MNAPVTPRSREYVLAALRCELSRLHLAAAEIEEIGLALKLNVISPEQAVFVAWGDDAPRLLGFKLEGGE